MLKIVPWGKDEVSGRDLFSLHLESAEGLSSLIRLSSRYFVCFLGWNSSNVPTSTISQVAEMLLRSGCVYFCLWGSGCERAHDVVDKVSVGSNPPPQTYPDIMTTWHDRESLDDALWFCLNSTWPDDAYWDDCDAAIVITIGLLSESQKRIDFALANPRLFSSEVLQKVEGDT